MKTLSKSTIYSLFALVFVVNVSFVSAHVVVKPAEVGAAAFQTFTVGVPVEKDIPTTSVRLVIPEGLKHVTPNVKPGWTIEVKKTGVGENAIATEIIWTGGEIPSGQRDEFLFSAQVPANETTLVWKAYQTYENGEVVAWDQKPDGGHDHGSTPYSETKIVNDLTGSSDASHVETASANTNSLPTVLSVSAFILSAGALFLQTRKAKK